MRPDTRRCSGLAVKGVRFSIQDPKLDEKNLPAFNPRWRPLWVRLPIGLSFLCCSLNGSHGQLRTPCLILRIGTGRKQRQVEAGTRQCTIGVHAGQAHSGTTDALARYDHITFVNKVRKTAPRRKDNGRQQFVLSPLHSGLDGVRAKQIELPA